MIASVVIMIMLIDVHNGDDDSDHAGNSMNISLA